MAVNVNYLFLVIGLLLAAILFLFEPSEVPKKHQKGEGVADLELHQFTRYDLTLEGLKDVMVGKDAKRYKDRIEIDEIDYTDNSRKLKNNITANFGVYNNINLITLEGNVRYHREDGLRFKTERAIIHQKDETIVTKGPFVMTKEDDVVTGEDLFYDSKNERSHATDVVGVYEVKN